MDNNNTDFFRELHENVEQFGSAPVFSDMPRRTLADKGIAGPTAAHVIEEVHVPRHLAGLTFTTGTSAFQNIVGITAAELPLKRQAAARVLDRAGLCAGDRLLVCYPPLVNVFTRQALADAGINWFFLTRSSRDAFLDALYHEHPSAVMGESSFIRSALEDASRLGVAEALPRIKTIMTAGTPLDAALPPLARDILHAAVYDVYGCQEFGWLTVNGEPVRDDLSLIASPLGAEYRECVVGGLPTGDSFPVTDNTHMLSAAGRIITYRRRRTRPDYEVVVLAAPKVALETLERTARTILRIKGRVVKIHPAPDCGAERTVLWLKPAGAGLDQPPGIIISGPDKTAYFDAMIQAQIDYQTQGAKDPVWTKNN